MIKCDFPYCKGCKYMVYDMGEFPMCTEPGGEFEDVYCYDATYEEYQEDVRNGRE